MADFTVIAEFDWSEVADDGVSDAHIPEIDFLIDKFSHLIANSINKALHRQIN